MRFNLQVRTPEGVLYNVAYREKLLFGYMNVSVDCDYIYLRNLAFAGIDVFQEGEKILNPYYIGRKHNSFQPPYPTEFTDVVGINERDNGFVYDFSVPLKYIVSLNIENSED